MSAKLLLKMQAKDLLTDEIPFLLPTDSGENALQIMEEFKISELPVVQEGKYLKLISEHDILDADKPAKDVALIEAENELHFIMEKQHMFEVINLMVEQSLSVLPVLNDKGIYVGLIDQASLFKGFARINAFNELGAVFSIEVNINDYSLATIAQIVESNNAKILSSYVSTSPNSTKMDVTIKVNTNDLSPIIQTFNRYDYTISAFFTENDHTNDLKDRYDSFMRYLDM